MKLLELHQEPLLMTMMRRLVDSGTLYYADSDAVRREVLQVSRVVDAVGRHLASLHLHDPEGGQLTRFLKFNGMDEVYTIRKEGDRQVVQHRYSDEEDLTEEKDRPIFASMLAKLLAAHFKKGGPAVYLVDSEFGDEPMLVRGYTWRDDALALNVKGGSHGFRDVVYPGSYVHHRNLKLKKSGDRWFVTVEV